MILPTASGHDGVGIRLAAIELPIILPDPELLPGLSRQIEALLTPRQHAHASPSRFLTLPMLYALVASGHGAGLLPRSLAVASDLNVMRPIRDARARVAVWLTERRNEEAPSVATLKALLAVTRRPA